MLSPTEPPATVESSTVSSALAVPVLVVEDDADLRGAIVEALANAGYAPVGADDGAHALTLLGQLSGLRCVVLDLLMPGMGGRVFLDELRRTEAGADVAVIVATGRRDASVPDAVAVLRKPFPVEELLRAVREACAR